MSIIRDIFYINILHSADFIHFGSKENSSEKAINLKRNSDNDNRSVSSKISIPSPTVMAANSSSKCKSSHSIDAILGLRAAAAAAAQVQAAHKVAQQEVKQSKQYSSIKPIGELSYCGL